MMNWTHELSVLLLAVMLSPAFGDGDAEPPKEDKVPPPKIVETDHKITALEILVIDVFGEKDLSNKECPVQASGKISFPMIVEVEVAGKTTTEVENLLKEMLGKDFLVNPQVTVSVKQYRLRTVNVMGEVTSPGSIPLLGEQKWTILDAIGQAKGFTRNARKTRIEFTRRGKKEVFSFDQLKSTTDPAKIIYLEPGDTIFVPQTWY